MVFQALREMNVEPERAVYVGDSDVDIETAANSGLPCISVTWGFRDREFLREHNAVWFADTTEEVLALVEQGAVVGDSGAGKRTGGVHDSE